MSTCESTLDKLAAWGSQTTEPAADTFQRYEMDETAPSAAQGALDIRSAPAAPLQRLEQPSPLQTLYHSSALDRRAGRHLYTSAQQEAAKQVANADMPGAGRARGDCGDPARRQGLWLSAWTGPSRDAPDREALTSTK